MTKLDERDWIIIRLLIDAMQLRHVHEPIAGRMLLNAERTIHYMQHRVGVQALADAIDKIHEERRNRHAEQTHR